jgi:hypothetical protein
MEGVLFRNGEFLYKKPSEITVIVFKATITWKDFERILIWPHDFRFEFSVVGARKYFVVHFASVCHRKMPSLLQKSTAEPTSEYSARGNRCTSGDVRSSQ